MSQIPSDELIGTVTGAGAFHTRRCPIALRDRGGTAVIAIHRNSRLWRQDRPVARARTDILRAARRWYRANGIAQVPAIMSRGRIRARCATSHLSANRQPRGIPTANRRTPHPHRTQEPLQRPQRRRDRERAVTWPRKGQFRFDLNFATTLHRGQQ